MRYSPLLIPSRFTKNNAIQDLTRQRRNGNGIDFGSFTFSAI
jgi:hypothetical protein